MSVVIRNADQQRLLLQTEYTAIAICRDLSPVNLKKNAEMNDTIVSLQNRWIVPG